MRILLVEDDKLIGDGIKAGLSKMGFNVDWFTDGKTGQAALYTAPYDVVVLDLTLPEIDGLEILRAWRESGKSEPVLILTARDALNQRVEGLRLGADDYLCKPFALIEVAARLEALVRRSHGQARSELRHGKVTLDPAACCRARPSRRSSTTGMMTSPATLSKSTFIIYAASSAATLSAPCTASVIPWVTHETDPTPEPEAAPDAPLFAAVPGGLVCRKRGGLAPDDRQAR